MEDPPVNDDRCPICGHGTLVDIAFDEGDRRASKPAQSADSRQVVSFSCGHVVDGPGLDRADADALAVERRTSPETTDPPSS